MTYHYTNPLLPPPFFSFLLLQSTGGGGDMGPCALSYANDSGAARICQREAKTRERSDRDGGGCQRPFFENGHYKG